MELQKSKRGVLFCLVAIVPAAVLVGLATRLYHQENELANKHAADQRQEALEQVRRELATKLEAIKLEVVNRLRDESPASSSPMRPPADSAVAFVLPLEQDHLVMPWENKTNRALPVPEFVKLRERAEHVEFQSSSMAVAAGIYQRLLAVPSGPEQRCEVKLALARTLMKAGKADDGTKIYRAMLNECDLAMDEEGVSMSLYAAERLISNDLDVSSARQHVALLTKANRWWSPTQLYLMRSLLPSERLSAQIEDAEQLVSLARDFHSPSLFRVEWFAYGSEPWLVTVMSPMPTSSPYVMAVSSRKVAPPGTTLIGGHSETSTPLGERFMDVDVEWQPGRFAPVRRIPASLYWIGLAMILAATGSAGYLLMRDVRREVQTANLRSQFVASVSHELKTPLTAIRMFAETLALGRSRDERVRSEYLHTIVNESERLSRLVDNVLDFSRLERGEKIYRMELVSLPEVVRAAARAMQYPLSQHGFRLTLDIDDQVPQVTADADALEQAILNLLTNAMKYSGESRDIELRLGGTAREAIIDVTDHGCGIPQHEHERIFEKFYRVRSTATVVGTGLGLTLAMHIVKAHGGRIGVKSGVGTGSTFSVVIPYVRTENLS
jgi:signal transduction histidine kinase